MGLGEANEETVREIVEEAMGLGEANEETVREIVEEAVGEAVEEAVGEAVVEHVGDSALACPTTRKAAPPFDAPDTSNALPPGAPIATLVKVLNATAAPKRESAAA
jgi:hypothetical protein